MSHVLKIFLRIIHGRIYGKLEEKIGNTQFGFRKGLGTREALFGVQVLIQRCRDVNYDVYLCAIDFEKAFDRVHHNKMLEILKASGIDDKDIRIIGNLYWHQRAAVKIEEHFTDDIEIKRGVRQGCILSPLLFNLYSEEIFNEALVESMAGVIINGKNINNIRYADNTLLIANTNEDLQLLMNQITNACTQYGLKLNVKKTKYMIISKQNVPQDNGIFVDETPLEKVHKLTYLGSNINDNWDPSAEVKIRIERARAAFIRMKKVLCSHDLTLNLRMRMVRCYVFPVLLYGMEAWTLSDAMLKRLEAFEMWVYRRLLKISWVDRVRNTDVLARMNKDPEIIITIKRRKLEYFGHIMRHPDKYEILHLIMEGKINRKEAPEEEERHGLKI